MAVPRSQRKQWLTHDGSRGTLRRLRSQLAEDGCMESQMVMARNLLEDEQPSSGPGSLLSSLVDDDGGSSTPIEAAGPREAVYWLIRATEQGSQEARELLQQCYDTGRGISRSNLEDVKLCLNMGDQEREYRAAARELFHSLASAGDEYISTTQLRNLLNEEKAEDERDSVADVGENQHLSEEELVSIAARMSRGIPPPIRLTDEKQVDAKMGNLRQMARRIRTAIVSTGHRGLESVARHGDSFLISALPMNQLRTIAVVVLCSAINVDFLLLVIPLLLFYISLLICVITTFQLLHGQRQIIEFHTWTDILASTGTQHLDSHHTQLNYRRHISKFYVRFFAAYLSVVFCYPLCSNHWIPNSDLLAVAVLFGFLSVYALNEKCEFLVGSFLGVTVFMIFTRLGVIACPSFLSLSYYLNSHTEGEATSEDNFVISENVSVVTLILPVIFAKMAHSDSWVGVYKILLPNLLAASWLQMGTLFYADASLGNFGRGVLVWGAVIVLPLGVLVALAVILAVVTVRFLYQWHMLVPVASALALVGIVAGIKYALSRKYESLRTGRLKNIVILVQVIFGISALIQLSPTFEESDFTLSSADELSNVLASKATTLQWDVYYSYCHKPAWEVSTLATTRAMCQHLNGASIQWQGQVKHVRLLNVKNKVEDAISYLPNRLANWLRCLYGKAYAEDCADIQKSTKIYAGTDFLEKQCEMIRQTVREARYRYSKSGNADYWKASQVCHAQNWNSYEFEITVQMSSGYWNSADVFIIATNSFSDFVFQLDRSDHIEFIAMLQSDIGGVKPTLKLLQVKCLACGNDMQPAFLEKTVNVVTLLKSALRFTANFFLSPFIKVHPVVK